jgi:signal transduction histidine kinase
MRGDATGNTKKPWFDRLAHDLRSPLTSLQTAAYLLRSDPSGSNSRELADIVVRQSQRLARMIEELDDWSRAEQRRLVDRGERVELDGTVDMAIASLHGCALEPEYAPDAHGLVVQGDGSRLAQLFRTLCEQVVARDPDTARVTIAQHDGCAVLEFSDHGAALDEEARERLLQAPQIPPPDNGLGLRLLIAKAIVEGHEGSLQVDARDASLRIRCALPLAE